MIAAVSSFGVEALQLVKEKFISCSMLIEFFKAFFEKISI
jgi:hypothetical protein